MSGVSTCVWGPPLWRILHTISFAPTQQLRAHANVVVRFMLNLSDVLPCKWCRLSYAQFMGEMPDLRATIEMGGIARWMFDLHARVNAKLNAPTPKFESIAKRFIVRPVQWMPADVWDIISLFGLNFTSEKRKQYRIFWDSLPLVLRLGVGVDLRVAHLLSAVPCPRDQSSFIATSLVLEASFMNRPYPTPREARERALRYVAARSKGKCNSGVCE